jgi:iron complex outermembrane receptor protein
LRGIADGAWDWSYRSRYFTQANNTLIASQPAFSLFDASLRYRSAANWSLQAGVRNLTDEAYIAAATSALPTLGFRGGAICGPREWFVTARYEF